MADEAVLRLMAGGTDFWATPTHVDHDVQREVQRALDFYAARGWLEDPSDYHVAPEMPCVPKFTTYGWKKYEHMTFDSGYEPRAGEPGRERWATYRGNRTAHAWVLRHRDVERPWLLAIHGYGMGYAAADFRAIRARYLHEKLGMNVVCYVMPLHGPRREGLFSGTGLFSGGIANLVHGQAQAMWDLRRILAWIRAEGGQRIGVHGLSLGGYTTALLATLDDDLACAVAGVPASCFIELFRRHMPPEGREADHPVERFWEQARRVLRVVSPLAAAPRVAHDRRFIFAGLGDRLIPPQAVRVLWEHWDRPRITWFPGSHVSFMLEDEVRALMDEAFLATGMSAN